MRPLSSVDLLIWCARAMGSSGRSRRGTSCKAVADLLGDWETIRRTGNKRGEVGRRLLRQVKSRHGPSRPVFHLCKA